MIASRLLYAVYGCVAVLWTNLPAEAQQPVIRAHLTETGKIVPGQQIHLVLDVLVPNFFHSPPQFPLFTLPNALVTLPSERSQNMSEMIEGVQFSGIEKRYSILPQISGAYEIPPINVSFSYMLDGQEIQATATSPLVRFEVDETALSKTLLVATSVDLSQSFDQAPDTLQVGDAVVRTVIIQAENTLAIAMPSIDFGAAKSLVQYIKPPKLDDNIMVGRKMVSRRIETVVYTAADEGPFFIPEVSYPWSEAGSAIERTATLPPVNGVIRMKAGNGKIIKDVRPGQVGSLKLILLVSIMWPSGIWLLFVGFRQLKSVWQAYQQEYKTSQRYLRLQTAYTIRTGNKAQIYTTLHEWSDLMGYASLSDWAEASGAPVVAQIVTLERDLFGNETPVDADDRIDRHILIDTVHRQTSIIESKKPTSLAPLNPFV